MQKSVGNSYYISDGYHESESSAGDNAMDVSLVFTLTAYSKRPPFLLDVQQHQSRCCPQTVWQAVGSISMPPTSLREPQALHRRTILGC